MAKYYNMHMLSVLQNIDHLRVGVDGEPLLEHAKHCMGCNDCIIYRSLIEERKRYLDNQEIVDGMTMAQALKLRKTHTIHYYYPRGDEFRKANGQLDVNVYLKLKNVDGPDGKGFTDAEIWNYFGINQGESQRFKQKYFEKWIGGKDDYIEGEESLAAIEEYDKKYKRRKATRVRYVPRAN